MRNVRLLVALTIIAAVLTACGSRDFVTEPEQSGGPAIWGVVTGAVHDAAGKPVEGALVVPTSADSNTPAAPEKAVTTDQDGRYVWQLVGGIYDLVARDGDRTSAPLRVRVPVGQSTVADLVLP